MPNFFVCTYGNFDERKERIEKSQKGNCYFLHEYANYPTAINEIKAGDIILLKDNAMIIAWGEAENHPGTASPVAHTGADGWKHIVNVEKWHKDISSVHSYGLHWNTLIGGRMSLVKKVTPRWALEKLALMKQIDSLPFIEQDIFELSLDDIASWYHDNIYSDKGIFATVPALQRGLVWSAQQNELFWDSIMRKIPVGAILLCPMILSQEKRNTAATHHILDGQQRCNAISKGFDFKPFEQDDAIIWIDINPDKEQLKNTSRRYLIRVSTVAHPWGYEITDESGKAACLDTASIREALKKVAPTSLEGKKRIIPSQMYPEKANLPIPLGFLLHSFLQTENENDFWQNVLNCINNIPFEDLKDLLKDFINNDDNDKQKEHIYTGIKNAMSYKMIAMNAPETIITEDAEDNAEDGQSTIEHLFQRINRQGTRLDGEELIYSTIKSYWPEVANTLDKCANKRMLASRLLVLTIRAALSDNELRGNISVTQIRGLIKDEAHKKKITSCLESLENSCKQIDSWLQFSEENNPNGLPPVLYTTIAHAAPEIYLLLLILTKENKNLEHQFIVSLVLLLYFYDFRKRNSRRGNIIRDLFHHCKSNGGFSQENIIQNIREQFKKDEKFILPIDLQAEIKMNEEYDIFLPEMYEQKWRQCFERFRCNKDLLLYAQTQHLCKEFPDFDPARKDLWQDHNRPWDYDHIVAQNIVASWNDFKNNGWLWCIGNFAAIPLEENRSKSDAVNFEYYKKFEKELFVKDSRLLKEFTIDSQKEFRKAVFDRFLLIYSRLYKQVCRFLPTNDNIEELAE